MICPKQVVAWVRVGPGDADDGLFRCRLEAGHDGEHVATGLFAHQSIHWQGTDRRTFEGEFVRCPVIRTHGDEVCVLPIHHHGSHAF